MASVIASWEPSWCEAGLGAPAVHVEVEGLPREDLIDLLGAALCTPVEGAPCLLRLDPSLDLATFEEVLKSAGWRVKVEVEGRLSTARLRVC